MTPRPTTPLEAITEALASSAPQSSLWANQTEAAELLDALEALGWHLSPLVSVRTEAVKGSRPTSRAAAESLEDLTGPQSAVLDLIAANGERGLTDEEINAQYPGFAAANGYPQIASESPRKRRMDLSESSWVVDSGRTRPNRSGREATVWVVRRSTAVAA